MKVRLPKPQIFAFVFMLKTRKHVKMSYRTNVNNKSHFTRIIKYLVGLLMDQQMIVGIQIILIFLPIEFLPWILVVKILVVWI